MTVWDFLDKLVAISPPVLAVLLIAAAGVLFLVGFGKHGADFLKHGFKQTALDTSIENRFTAFEQQFREFTASQAAQNEAIDRRLNELNARIDGVHTELNMIKTNHFGHLKNYLGVLNGILLDKNVISNQDKARLDNELRGM
jgi:FixJ family two-component response regulator